MVKKLAFEKMQNAHFVFPSDIHVPTSLRNKLKHKYKTCTTNLSSL